MEGRPVRKPLRLPRFDYATVGGYFITVCTHERTELFWEVGRAGLGPAPTNEFGDAVLAVWEDLPSHIPGLRLDKFVVMPNHIHGILVLEPLAPVGAGSKPAHRPSVTEIVRQFKTFSARRVNCLRGTPGIPVWQRSFHDHVIRNEKDYLRIWQYIHADPARWREDEYYPHPQERS